MKWLKKWFTLPPQTNSTDKRPSHERINKETSAIMAGEDDISSAVHDQKNDYTRDLLKLQYQAKIVEKSATEFRERIDTAVAIAIALVEAQEHKKKRKKK